MTAGIPSTTRQPHRTGQRRHRRYSPTVLVVSILAAFALLVSACGGDSNESGSKPDTDTGSSNENPEINPDNCPVDALDDADGPVEITIWHAYNALTKTALEEAGEEFNKSQDKVKVNIEAQGTYPELLEKYEGRLSDPSSLPDVVFAEDTNLRFLIDSDSVIPSGDCIAADPDSKAFYDDILPVVRNTYAINDVLWPAAFGVSMPIMFVNKAHLTKAGLDDSTPLETLADIRAAAEKIKAANIPGIEAPVVMQLYGWYYENWITGTGETIVNEANGHTGLATESTIDNPAAHEILQWMHDMAADGLLKGYPYSASIDQFLAVGNQSASILLDGSRAVTAVDAIVNGENKKIEEAKQFDTSDLEGIEMQVMPEPGLKKAGQGGAAGSAGYVVAGSAPEKIAASWDFLKFFNSPATQIKWTTVGSYLPVTSEVLNSAEIQDFFTNDSAGKSMMVVEQQLQGSNADFPNPIIGPYNWFRTEVQSMMDRVVLQGQEPDQNLTAFHDAFNKQLSDYAQEVGG